MSLRSHSSAAVHSRYYARVSVATFALFSARYERAAYWYLAYRRRSCADRESFRE